MWLELDYVLETSQGNRLLLLKSNFKQDEKGEAFLDKGVYTIHEYATFFHQVTVSNASDEHEEVRSFWDLVELGTLTYDWRNSNSTTWSGNPNDFTNTELAKIAHFASTWHEPACLTPDDMNIEGVYIIDEGLVEIKAVTFPDHNPKSPGIQDAWITDLWDKPSGGKASTDQEHPY